MKYKIGDTVKCIDSGKDFKSNNIVPQKGELYKVVKEDNALVNYMFVRDINGICSDSAWNENLFELVTNCKYVYILPNEERISMKDARALFGLPPVQPKPELGSMAEVLKKTWVAVVEQGEKQYLFECEDLVLVSGSMVIVNTKNGYRSGVVDKLIQVEKESLKDIVKFYGATLPLRKVVLTYKK